MKKNKLRTVFTSFFAASLIYGCATGPGALRYLDERTGATVSKVRSPLVFYRDRSTMAPGPVTGEVGEDFLTLAPFEVNRQGQYALYMRVEWPGTLGASPGSLPTMHVVVDGEKLPLEPHGTDPQSLGIASPVYPEDLFSARVGYYRMNWAQLERIATATTLQVAANNDTAQFVPWGKQNTVLESFREFEELPRPDRYRSAFQTP